MGLEPTQPDVIRKVLAHCGLADESPRAPIVPLRMAEPAGPRTRRQPGPPSRSERTDRVCTCPWDLDGDDVVGTFDRLFLLGAWGPGVGDPADFDFDGTVGTFDLLVLLVNWVACP